MKARILIVSFAFVCAFAGAGKKDREVVEKFRSGKPRRIASYRKDLLNGPSKIFFENGNVRSETYFRNGLRHGTEKIYFETGIQSQQIEWASGKKAQETNFYPTGKKKLDEKFEGRLVRRTEFHESGSPRLEVYYKSDIAYVESEEIFQKFARRFNENGKLLSETSYREGKRDGNAKTFYENGKIAEHRLYDKGKLVSRTEYDLRGKITLSEEYDEDGNRK